MPPLYSPIPTADRCDPEAAPHHHKRGTGVKKAVSYIFSFIVFMYALSFVARGLPRVCRMMASKEMHTCAGNTTHGMIGHPHGNLNCYGTSRTMSTGPRLPSFYTLPSGDKIPAIALGVWRADPGLVGKAVRTALKAGYRHIDGAWIYGNEVEAGKAIRDSGIPRSDIWITSKLWNSFHAPEDVEPALDESLARLGTDYVDLYLMHWPVAFKKGQGEKIDYDLTENPYPTWQKLEEMVEKGKARNIGISNFSIRRIQNLTANPLKIKPALNQVELNFWNPQPELLKWSKENGLLVEAYSPLGSQNRVKETLNVPEVKSIAKELGITPAQVVLSWQAQRGTIVLSKSVTPSRVIENLHIVPLPQEAFDKLEKAAVAHEPKRSVNPNWGVDIWN